VDRTKPRVCAVFNPDDRKWRNIEKQDCCPLVRGNFDLRHSAFDVTFLRWQDLKIAIVPDVRASRAGVAGTIGLVAGNFTLYGFRSLTLCSKGHKIREAWWFQCWLCMLPN
jgi:hypothetical protein